MNQGIPIILEALTLVKKQEGQWAALNDLCSVFQQPAKSALQEAKQKLQAYSRQQPSAALDSAVDDLAKIASYFADN